jgi:hypothetical protein
MTYPVRLLAALIVAASSAFAAAGEPVVVQVTPSSGFFAARRPVAYAVVDTVPRATYAPASYPYGWFGAAPHATVRWSHTDYYGNYTDVRILRGR